MSMQSLKKIGQKVLKLEHGNEVLMDRRTDDGRTDTQSSEGITLYTATSCVAGYKNTSNLIVEYKILLKAIPKLWKETLLLCNMNVKVKKECRPFLLIDG